MVATIQQIIGKINPLLYAANGKELLKKYGSAQKIPVEEVVPQSLLDNELEYDSSSETLEPIYFFILDLMQDRGLKPEKLVDNFSSSPGSGHFAELGQRATIMQQQGAKILGDVNTVLRSVLNIIYDLKEFRIRLEYYKDFKSKDQNTKTAALLALKQIWMDKVDISKGNSSIKAMGLGQAGFQTLIDAFLASNSVEDANKLDLNDRVKRILIPRIQEFNIWIEQSEQELQKRYEIEKTYLRSQVNSLKLYSRWAKPYLAAAQQLEAGDSSRNPALVKVFNTIILELTLFGKSKLKVKESALEGSLPTEFSDDKFLKTLKRNYHSCFLIDFTFRGIPQRVAQQSHYVFGGKANVVFRAYALNDDEINELNEQMKKSEVEDVLQLIEGATTESLKQLQDEINFFLEEKPKEEKPKKRPGFFKEFSESMKKTKKDFQDFFKPTKKEEAIKPDNFIEKEHLRKIAASNAEDVSFDLFDIYKKAHGMESYT